MHIKNRFAFMDINNVVKNPTINAATWAYLISQPIPTNHNAMDLVRKKFPTINRNNYQYYDLDSIQKIEINSFNWEYNCKLESIQNNLLPYHLS